MDTLTATAIRNAKPGDKVQRPFDGRGLYLEITSAGARYWRLKYRHAGKEKRLALGAFPVVSLAEARKLREDARKVPGEGRDPSAARKADRVRVVLSNATPFQGVGAMAGIPA